MTVPLSKFILNTDYTSIKEATSFNWTLNVGDTIVQAGDGVTRSIDITVPSGVYFENTTISLSATGETTPSPFVVYVKETGEYSYYQIVASLVKVNATTYRLYAYIQNMSGNVMTVPGFSVNVKSHLFVSSF
jgi:hypothetical protein